MKKRLDALLRLALKYHASDIHFNNFKNEFRIEMRIDDNLRKVKSENCDYKLIKYLQYLANLDLGNLVKPQTGQFEWVVDGELLSLRFALIHEFQMENAVLRILNNDKRISLDRLSSIDSQNNYLKRVIRQRAGLFIVTGPTSNGKTTSLYTMLNSVKNRKIFTIEDPVEIHSNSFIQVGINEAIGLDYDEAIKQVLRHDPDIIMIGEIRDEITAKMAIRAANTGHLVITSLHSGSCLQTINRILELGVDLGQLKNVIVGIVNQRLYKRKDSEDKLVVMEIMDKDELDYYFKYNSVSERFIPLKKQIYAAIKANQLDPIEAEKDLI